ncbi:MAG TPA: NUDIX domain-containing protein [Pirellulales bacterium]|nr:NUDIX domain-containing protein [Pirellulales bacterium]
MPCYTAAMKQSAGVLLYRFVEPRPSRDESLEVLLVHPSGNYNRQAPWSIPKGLPDPGEALEAAARRESVEETGVVAGSLLALGSVILTKSRKEIHAFAGEAPEGAAPSPTSWEVDRAEFVTLASARQLLHPDQVPLLDRLLALLESKK